MSNYVDIVAAVKALFTTYKNGSLSDGMTTHVQTITTGQYVTNAASDKPAIYIRLVRLGEIATMAGNQSRKVKPVLLISGACMAETQQKAHDEAITLLANIENILAQNSHGGATGARWSGGSFGQTGFGSDDSPEPYGEVEYDPGVEISIAHFKLIWGCECMVSVDALHE